MSYKLIILSILVLFSFFSCKNTENTPCDVGTEYIELTHDLEEKTRIITDSLLATNKQFPKIKSSEAITESEIELIKETYKKNDIIGFVTINISQYNGVIIPIRQPDSLVFAFNECQFMSEDTGAFTIVGHVRDEKTDDIKGSGIHYNRRLNDSCRIQIEFGRIYPEYREQ